MASRSPPPSFTQARLKELLHYEPATGAFTWRETRSPRAVEGGPAGSKHVTGYIYLIVEGRSHKAHRLAWFYVHGEWPEEIDHINRVRDDNRLENLRAATECENRQNVSQFITNRSGFKGVGQHNGRWRARISVERRSIWLGHFPTAEAAYEAYRTAAHKYHGEFAGVE